MVTDAEGEPIQRIPALTRFEDGWLAPRVLRRGGRWRWVPTSGIAMRRQVADLVFPMPEEGFSSSADTFFLMLVPLLTPIASVDEVLATYRRHGSNHFARTRFDTERVPKTLQNLELSVDCVNERLEALGRSRLRLHADDNLKHEELEFQQGAVRPSAAIGAEAALPWADGLVRSRRSLWGPAAPLGPCPLPGRGRTPEGRQATLGRGKPLGHETEGVGAARLDARPEGSLSPMDDDDLSGAAPARPGTTAKRQTSKRAAWGLTDQAFSSITNFALASIVARTVTAVEFGAFSLVFSVYLLVLGVVRAFATLPMLVRYSASEHEGWSDGARRATGWAIVGGGIAAAVCAGLSLVFRSAAGPLLALGVSLPGLMLQETWRLAFVARGKPAAALVNDIVWALVLAPALWLAVQADTSSATAFILAWGLSGTVAGIFGMLQAGFLPHPQGVRPLDAHPLGHLQPSAG